MYLGFVLWGEGEFNLIFQEGQVSQNKALSIAIGLGCHSYPTCVVLIYTVLQVWIFHKSCFMK